jgi:hypothetical protein
MYVSEGPKVVEHEVAQDGSLGCRHSCSQVVYTAYPNKEVEKRVVN